MALSSTRFAALLFFCGCATTPGPVETAESYARALEEARWSDAAELSHQSADALSTRYADEAARRQRAAEIRESQSWTAASGVTVRQTPQGWRVEDLPPKTAADTARADAATQALSAFLEAVAQRDFESAWKLLAGPLRARYSPQSFQRDFEAEPLAEERLSRARAASTSSPQLTGAHAHFPIGEGRAVRLVEEQGGWRVEALE